MGFIFERFTEESRQAVVQAQNEARQLGHSHIGTEHLLLGLLRVDESLAARVLATLGIGIDELREAVALRVGRGEEPARGQIPFTPRAKKVLELALREALLLGDNYIGTEHILLGLVREGQGAAATILAELGADAESVRNEVARSLSGPARQFRARMGPRRRFARGPQRWEFRVERWPGVDPAERGKQLAELGADGWHLAAVVPAEDGAEWIFQRPASGPPAPPQPGDEP